jgi:hypothetical protein
MYVVVEAVAAPDAAAAVAAVRAAAVPIARLRPNDLELRPIPGGLFPGKPLTDPADEYQARHRMLEDIHPSGGHSGLDATPALLIDRHTPVAVLLGAIRALAQPAVALAVAGSGPGARVHPIAIRRLTGAGSAAPILRRTADGYTLLGTSDTHFGTDQAAREALRRALLELSVALAPVDVVELQLGSDSTADGGASGDIAALVELLDLVASSRFAAVLMRDAPGSQ